MQSRTEIQYISIDLERGAVFLLVGERVYCEMCVVAVAKAGFVCRVNGVYQYDELGVCGVCVL